VIDEHSNVGSYAIKCSGGVDNNYNFSYVDASLKIIDTTVPVITLNGGKVSFDRTHSYHERGATWTDNVDGSGTVTQISGTVNNDKRGNYMLTYSYTDAAGNTGYAYRTVTVNKHNNGGNGDGNGNDSVVGRVSSAIASLFGNGGVQGASAAQDQGAVSSAEDQQIQGQEAIAGVETQQDYQPKGFWQTFWPYILLAILAGGGYAIWRRKSSTIQ
jgi:hypothetical protein